MIVSELSEAAARMPENLGDAVRDDSVSPAAMRLEAWAFCSAIAAGRPAAIIALRSSSAVGGLRR
jgi:hypothetical protein